MRIALVAESQAPWTPHYARAFKVRGHQVTVFSFSPGEIPGVETVVLHPGDHRGGWDKLMFLTRAPRLRRLLRAHAPDVVLATYLISDGLAARLAWDGPMIVSARGGDVLDQAGNPPIPGPVRAALARYICRPARVVHAVSEEIAEQLATFGVDRGRLVVFPMGVDVGRFHPGPEPDPGAPRLVCTRRHDAVYDNHVVVSALALLKGRIPGLRATFVGGGPLLEARRAQAAREGLDGQVEFVAQVDHRRLPDCLRGHGVYVSASTSDGTSSSLLEAMACGLVPVVSRIRANLDWVRDGDNGFLFEVRNAADLARAIERACGDAAVRARARAANPALVAERGNQQVNNQRLLDLLEQAARPGS